MTLSQMKAACDEAKYLVDDFAKNRDIRTSECAEAIRELAKAVAELVKREEKRLK